MSGDELNGEVAEVDRRLAPEIRLALIGGTSFWHEESEATCDAIGLRLSAIPELVLLTAGVSGAGEALGRAFHRGRGANVFHILPRGSERWDYGTTLFAGTDMRERREVLGRLAGLHVSVEGGPGTAHEASIAFSRSAVVIPVGRSGGHSAELYARIPRPFRASAESWRILGAIDSTPDRVAAAVVDIVAIHLSEKLRKNSAADH